MKKNKNIKRPGFKKLKCKYCNNISFNVDSRATARTCWRCTSKLVNGQTLELSK